MTLLHPLLQAEPVQGMQTITRPAFPLVRWVARGGVEPPTFRFTIDYSGDCSSLPNNPC